MTSKQNMGVPDAFYEFLNGNNPYLSPANINILRLTIQDEYRQIEEFAKVMKESKEKDASIFDNGAVYVRYAADMQFNVEMYLDTIEMLKSATDITPEHRKHYKRVISLYLQFQGMNGLSNLGNPVTQYLLGTYPEYEAIDDRAVYPLPARGGLMLTVTTAPYPAALLLGTAPGAMQRYAKLLVADDNLEMLYNIMSPEEMTHFRVVHPSVPFRSTICNKIIGDPKIVRSFGTYRAYGSVVGDLTRLFERLSLEYQKSGSLFTSSPNAETIIKSITLIRNVHRRETRDEMERYARMSGYIL